MARHPTTMDAGYFETMFRETSDPWDLETSAYEQAKYEDSVQALSGRIYAHALEVGCAKGMLTARLAPQCEALLAIDVSETALQAARKRVATFDQVAFERMMFPKDTPSDRFDLVVLSEVAYYWDDADLARAADWLQAQLVSGGDLLLVHFTGETDYPQSGDDAVTKLWARLGERMTIVRADRRARYRLDLWRHTI
ncbi:SAM-dependent methyltransferase [Sphingobium sp. CR2-8]|uniref:SAM-dependent methyltransferase n=1 Tax=Sphingobium sp. CR2-8 TaxID=1306534 RepID=UPI002DBD5021|nr:SAM-dependent methyltransferase [Sphingobium sp. CR2-8]MEC3912432.1 SAM-dependent methyltransferase [Sphingobium sp. CR2-8]